MVSLQAMVVFAALLSMATAGVCAGDIALEKSTDLVDRYGKIEFTVDPGRTYDDPFDPAVVDISLEVTGPAGVLLTPGFFVQEYETAKFERGRKTESWFYPIGGGTWKVRFAPMAVGGYSAKARVTDERGTAYSNIVRFACGDSASKGFLQIGRQDPRFFEFDNGEHFFAIGQNVAFIGEGQYVNLAKADEIFARLADNGANFARIWTCCNDWAMSLEAKKSAWDRSWSRNADIVAAQGDAGGRKCVRIGGDKGAVTCNPTHPVALRPQTRYVVGGRFMGEAMELNASPGLGRVQLDGLGKGKWQTFSREFTTGAGDYRLSRVTLSATGGEVYLARLSLTEAGGGAELLGEADVNRDVIGVYNQLDCAMLDELVTSAERRGIYLMLCVVTRDLYMKSLSKPGAGEYAQATADVKKFMRYCVARWGYSTAVGSWEYFNEMDPGKPTDAFYDEVGRYMETVDVYRHLRTTSTWHPSAGDIRHSRIDVGQLHHYMRPEGKEDYEDEVAVIVEKTKFLRDNGPGKPVLIGEFGLATPKWGLSSDMKTDAGGVHFRRSLWASAFAGSSGTAMFWWWDQLDRQNAYGHYKPLADFLRGVSFAGLKQADATADNGLRVLGHQGADRAYVWLSDPKANWHEQVIGGNAPQSITGATLQVRGLTDGPYHAVWFDTQKGGQVAGGSVESKGGLINIEVPTFESDIACRIERR